MTPAREIALYKQWNKHPPVHHLVAAYMGYKPNERGNIADLAEGGLPNV